MVNTTGSPGTVSSDESSTRTACHWAPARPCATHRGQRSFPSPHGPASRSLVQRLINLGARSIQALPKFAGRRLGIRVDSATRGGVAATSEGGRGRSAGVMIAAAKDAGPRCVVGVICLLSAHGRVGSGGVLVAAE